jgi:hypothetical protein
MDAARSPDRAIGLGAADAVAETMDDIRQLLPGNPVFEAGGTVELLEEVID